MSTAHAEANVGERSVLAISTVAGTGIAGFAGDEEAAVSAQLNSPCGIAVDSSGALYISDLNNHRVRMVTADGKISTIVGTGAAGYQTDQRPRSAASSLLNGPRGLAVDGKAVLCIADADNHLVRLIPPHRKAVMRVAGTGTAGFGGDGGPGVGALLNHPMGIVVDSGNVKHVADTDNHRVRKITNTGNISTIAGTGTAGYGGDGGPALAAQLNRPHGVVLDGEGNLYVADTDNHRVRKVTADGTISTVAGTGAAGFGGDDGPATSAQLNHPSSVVVDSTGVLYVADTDNHRVRRITTDGVISTVAGSGVAGFDGDDGPAASAQLNHPLGLAVDGEDVLYVADTDNHRVRKLAPAPAPAVVLPESGTLVFWTSVRSGLRMGVLRESTKDGAEVHQSLVTPRPHQRWRLVVVGQDNGNVLYTIENARSGKVLEVVGAQEEAGAIVAQRAYEGDDAHHQQWRLIQVVSTPDAPLVYEIANRNSGLCLGVDTNARSVIKQHTAEGDDRNRHWQLLPV
ncbi:RICIN domain-containing protein [Streptomyces niveus]|uniref:NHL domain-containing protein n=1 Tax=Streptomyces niveus TaxID=193462 RepID=UPI00386934C7